MAFPLWMIRLLCVLLWGGVAALADTPPVLRTLPLPYANDIVWDATRSRFFVASGLNVLLVNPETAQIEDTLYIGATPSRVAISSDGQFLYVAIGSQAVVNRYQVANHALTSQILLGTDAQGRRKMPAYMVALPGQPDSVLLALGYWPALDQILFPVQSSEVVVMDGTVQRPQTFSGNVSSLYVRPGDGAIFGWGGGQIYGFAVSGQGVTKSWSAPVGFSPDSMPTWAGNLITDRSGTIFDLNARATTGHIATAGCVIAANAAGDAAYGALGDFRQAALLRFSTATLLQVGSVDLGAGQSDFLGACDFVSVIKTWGVDGLLSSSYQHNGGGSNFVFFHPTGLVTDGPPNVPSPIVDSSGGIRLPLAANSLVYDAVHKRLWAGIPGSVNSVGNSVVGIDPSSGRVMDVIFVGGEPTTMAIASDGSRLYAALANTPLVADLDLNGGKLLRTFSVLDPAAPAVSYSAVSLAPVPGQADSVVVLRTNGITNYLSGILVYTNGVARANVVANLGNRVYPGDAANSYYATDTQIQFGGGTHTIYRLVTDASGIRLDRALQPILLGNDPNFWVSLLVDGGRLYTSQGELWTADISQLLGRFSGDGLPVVFPLQNRVAYAQTSGVKMFDVATFQPVAISPFAYDLRTMHAAAPLGNEGVAAAFAGDIRLIPLSSMKSWDSYCAPTLDPGGQAFPAAGGYGFATVTVNAGCDRSISSGADWVKILSVSDSGSPFSIQYQVVANDGEARFSSLNIAGKKFSIEQQAVTVPGLSFVGSMPHWAVGATWETTFTLVNHGNSPATARVNFFEDFGNELSLPLRFPQIPESGSLRAASLDRTITPGASLILNTAGSANRTVQTGAAQLLATGNVGGFAIFRYNLVGQEAVVPLEIRNAPSYVLAFDTTNGVALGVALQNVSASPASVPMTIRDDTGAVIRTLTLALAAHAHASLVIGEFPLTDNRRGTVTFTTPPGGQISVLGVRFTPPGTLTTIPALANIAGGISSVAHIAVGGGWTTTAVLVNTGASAAQADLAFLDDAGNALPLPITYPQSGTSAFVAEVHHTIGANASLVLQGTGLLSDPVRVGSMRLNTNGNVGGYVIFRYVPSGQEASTPFQDLGANAYIIAFDHTEGVVTGIAVNNASPQAVTVPVTVRDDNGAQIASGSIAVAPNGHTAFGLSTQFPQAVNIRGTVEFASPSGARINVLGIRTTPALTFTTLPPIAR